MSDPKRPPAAPPDPPEKPGGPDPGPPTSPAVAGLDWSDPAAVERWLAHLRTAWEDAKLVAEDMLRRPRRRDLGPREHARLHRDARRSIDQLLAHAGAKASTGAP